jgi:hypothetical protein
MEQLIYHLVAFPDNWMKAQEKYSELCKKADKKSHEEFINDKRLYYDWLCGGRHRGSFTDKDQLIKIIKDSTDPYGICECYYEYLLIETHVLNGIDSCLFSPDSTNEMWFHYVKLDEDNWEYQEIPRPECLMGTCNFL